MSKPEKTRKAEREREKFRKREIERERASESKLEKARQQYIQQTKPGRGQFACPLYSKLLVVISGSGRLCFVGRNPLATFTTL